ncbi:uncharacterized protein F4807DRAFT_441935 [Annulohypoxylon truncatum]|uniref:uncharacterized protein n=1 Tax=Annulohypoxylon truncatum TaxID=327061 RepID=UPI002007D4E7|nr:uncharacterized protein F4807DRAFT_441935 [Annulohypoxylon truncatum]KAI1205691.1 hypothetical protein F4807DRAFT_441935 [Annulohypoxylon truncatum]
MRPIIRYRPTWRQHHIPTPTPYTHTHNHLLRTTHHARSSSTSPSPPDHPLLYPGNSGSGSTHNDLASYAAYAARTGLDLTSKTYVGTRYEYAVAAALAPLGFDLRRVGGRDDCGIDLLGTWRLPIPPFSSSISNPHPHPPLRVLVQCKASAAQSTKIKPHQIRELEGAFAGAPPAWRHSFLGSPYPTSTPGSPILGFLVTQKPATKGVRDALGRSRWPMGFVSCTTDGRLEQMLWNGRAEEEGLEGLGVGVRFCEAKGEGEEEGKGQTLVLTWRGRPCEPV